MTSLVIGSNGYLGSSIAYYLRRIGMKVTCADVQDYPLDNDFSYMKIDITNLHDLSRLDFNVDYIFLFSGLTGTWNGFENYSKLINVNEIGLLNILTTYRNKSSNARIVFPSTRLVYKGKKGILLREDDEKDPKTIYALNKVVCEEILRIYHSIFSVNYTVFRICVPYGHIAPEISSYGTIDFFLRKAKGKENITLYGDGKIFRTFTHVEDICIKIIDTIQKEESNSQTYNIGGEHKTLFEIASLISKRYKVKVETADWPDNEIKIESGDTIFDASKIENLTSSSYLHSIEKWLI